MIALTHSLLSLTISNVFHKMNKRDHLHKILLWENSRINLPFYFASRSCFAIICKQLQRTHAVIQRCSACSSHGYSEPGLSSISKVTAKSSPCSLAAKLLHSYSSLKSLVVFPGAVSLNNASGIKDSALSFGKECHGWKNASVRVERALLKCVRAVPK